MHKPAFNPDRYLQRIGISTDINLTIESLDLIHQAQSFTIPFENLDIQLGRKISLEPLDIFNKLVLSRRGGYCFELNGLLLSALQHFGFKARSLLARVHLRGTPTGRTHQLILVTIKNQHWLADTGFGGGGIIAPIPLELNQISQQNELSFRLTENSHYGTMLQVKKEESWQDLYSFDLSYVNAADIAISNYFTSSHPQSLFRLLRMVTLPRKGGRLTLLNLELKTILHGKENISEISPGQRYIDSLEENFGIQLDQAYEAFIPLDQTTSLTGKQ